MVRGGREAAILWIGPHLLRSFPGLGLAAPDSGQDIEAHALNLGDSAEFVGTGVGLRGAREILGLLELVQLAAQFGPEAPVLGVMLDSLLEEGDSFPKEGLLEFLAAALGNSTAVPIVGIGIFREVMRRGGPIVAGLGLESRDGEIRLFELVPLLVLPVDMGPQIEEGRDYGTEPTEGDGEAGLAQGFPSVQLDGIG